MKQEILSRLRRITPEETAILDGRKTIDRDIYMQGRDNTVNARRLVASGKLITLRPHTRFIHFPEHRHDYVEVVFQCAGSTTHIVSGQKIQLKTGELLLMSQYATHEVLNAGRDDIAVNFIVLPDFFNGTLDAIGSEETPLRRFLVDCLCGQNVGAEYLHFKTAGIIPVENLVENLICILLDMHSYRRKASQMTMALLFLQLMDCTDTLATESKEDAAVFEALKYIETDYARGSFAELSQRLHYSPTWLSREIKEKTGKTYKNLIQEKRMSQAAFLLKNTERNIDEIAHAVGYENISYFYRLFEQFYEVSPKKYRDTQLCKKG